MNLTVENVSLAVCSILLISASIRIILLKRKVKMYQDKISSYIIYSDRLDQSNEYIRVQYIKQLKRLETKISNKQAAIVFNDGIDLDTL